MGGAVKGGYRERLLGFKSISPAEHRPEEMGSLLCAFTVVCCCWEPRADTKTACLYMAPKCTLSALTRWNRGPVWRTVTHQMKSKHFVRLTKTQFTAQHRGVGGIDLYGGAQRDTRHENNNVGRCSVVYILRMEFSQCVFSLVRGN